MKTKPFSSADPGRPRQPKRFTEEEIKGRYFLHSHLVIDGSRKLCGLLIGQVAIFAALSLLAGDPTTNNPNPEPQPATNAVHRVRPRPQRMLPPQQLQSAENTNTPAATQAPPTPPAKEMAIIIYGAHVFQVNGQQVWIIPERYMEDMKHIYKFQLVPKAALPEP